LKNPWNRAARARASVSCLLKKKGNPGLHSSQGVTRRSSLCPLKGLKRHFFRKVFEKKEVPCGRNFIESDGITRGPPGPRGKKVTPGNILRPGKSGGKARTPSSEKGKTASSSPHLPSL